MKKLLFGLALVGTLTLSASEGVQASRPFFEVDCLTQGGGEVLFTKGLLSPSIIPDMVDLCRDAGGSHIIVRLETVL